MRRPLLGLLVGTLAVLPACSGGDEPVADHHDDGTEAESTGVARAALTASDPVSAAVAQSCTTSAVVGLSTQLVEEIQCLRPGTLARIDGVPGFTLGSAVFPYLQTPALTALVAAQKARGVTMSINSALRTLAQQYLLYRWYKVGRCGIGLAASPGKSNHESAVAVDINDNAAWRSAMAAKELRWLGTSDPVHFDYVGAGRVDLRGLSTLAFQRLWNRNHPEDKITEDGDYGPSTEDRLAKSPVGGFVKGADCTQTVPPLDAGPPGEVPTVPDAPEALPAEGADEGASDGCTLGRATPASLLPSALALLLLASTRRWRRRSPRLAAPPGSPCGEATRRPSGSRGASRASS